MMDGWMDDTSKTLEKDMATRMDAGHSERKRLRKRNVQCIKNDWPVVGSF